MNYAKKIKNHLSDYKKEKFPTVKDGYWRGIKYEHIFPSICGELNLLEPYRKVFLENDLSDIRFHQGFHHLNSSQAMCINFFFPLVADKKLEKVLQKLELDEEVKYETVEFERESDIDRSERRATNFDFYFETKSKKKFYFEIKYTENCFSKAVSDREHREKYERIYKDAADKKIKPEYNTELEFLNNYQIMRNLIHISEDSYVVFVIPEGNKSVYKQAKNAKKFVVENYESQVKVLSWNELYDIAFENRLKEYYKEFKEKYKL